MMVVIKRSIRMLNVFTEVDSIRFNNLNTERVVGGHAILNDKMYNK